MTGIHGRHPFNVGVTAHLPLHFSGTQAAKASEYIRNLPKCWIRDDLLFWTISFRPAELSSTGDLLAKIRLVAGGGHNLILNIVPCPRPDAPGWNTRIGGPWKFWFRPDFRLWDSIQETTQMQVDFVSNEWKKLGRTKSDLRFEWFNEPAAGHASGGDLPEPRGNWSLEFHAMCNHLLLQSGGLNLRGHKLVGPTLSFLGEPAAEDQEIKTAPGGRLAKWWTKIDQRALNSRVYSPTPIKEPSQLVDLWRPELERRIKKLRSLDIPVTPDLVSLNEWYVTHPMLGYPKPPYDEGLRAECIAALGEQIFRTPHLESAFFYCLLNTHVSTKPQDQHHTESSLAFSALCKYLALT